MSSTEAVNTKFYRLWFDPPGNDTGFTVSVADSIHSNTGFQQVCWIPLAQGAFMHEGIASSNVLFSTVLAVG